MSCDALALPLLEFLAYKAGCAYLSDLPHASGWQRVRLAHALERVPAEAAVLREWNDALAYLADGPPETSAQAAKERLIYLLSQPCTPGADEVKQG